MPATEPFYIEAQRHRLFAVHHPAEDASGPRTPVLICSPWGWDEVASYRPRRAWAQRLASAGHPTLRFDLPGTGDSSGSPRDPDLLATWLAAVGAAADDLAERSGEEEIAILGLGLGGLLALAAVEAGVRAAELITLAAPISGRAFVRSARQFSRLQAWNEGSASAAQPEGWIEASGFLLSAATIAELETLKPGASFGPGLKRVLTLSGRSGVPSNALTKALDASPVESEADGVAGWAQMVSHPERSRLAADAAEKVEVWLGRGGRPAAGGAGRPTGSAAVPAPTRIELDDGDAPIAEELFPVEQGYGRSFGVLATPAGGAPAGVCAVFLNAGGVRNIGPNRMWLERGREWAARGVPVLRVDLEALGEADGDPDGVPPGDEFFSSRFEPQVERVLDALAARGLGPHFVIVGLCSGGYFAFRTACADPRVRAALVINAGALVFRAGIFEEREAGKVSRVFDRAWLAKLLRGKVGWGKVRGMLASLAGQLVARLRRLGRGGGRSWFDQVQEDLDRLQASETRLTLMFSDNEGMADELKAEGFRATLAERPFVELIELPGADHTLRPLEAQAALQEALDERLERELAPAAGTSGREGLKSPLAAADDRQTR
jgi:pimeloyl-ACP methyl ester carboxylesterase